MTLSDSQQVTPEYPALGPLVSVLIPAFNEAGNLAANLGAIVEAMEALRSRYDYEVVVVDDGSSDGTGAIARDFALDHPRVTVLAHHDNMGLGRALQTGFRACRGDYVVTFDADLSYETSHLERLIDTIHLTGADVVAASPYMDGGSVEGVPFLRALLSRWANRLLRLMSNSHISTVTGMVRAYRRPLLQGLSLKSVDNQVNAEILYKAELLRSRIVEIPGHLRWTRDEEDTKRRRVNLSLVKTSIDFLFSGFIFRPFLFFVVPGVVLLLLAMYALGWFGYHVIRSLPGQTGGFDPVISGAFENAFEHSPHSFLIGGVAAIFAVQLISLGVISAQSKRYFEEAYHLATSTFRRLSERDDPGTAA